MAFRITTVSRVDGLPTTKKYYTEKAAYDMWMHLMQDAKGRRRFAYAVLVMDNSVKLGEYVNAEARAGMVVDGTGLKPPWVID